MLREVMAFIMRHVELAGGTATSEEALIHALETLKNNQNYEPDIIVFLQPTLSLRKEGDLSNVINNPIPIFVLSSLIEDFVWEKMMIFINRLIMILLIDYEDKMRNNKQYKKWLFLYF